MAVSVLAGLACFYERLPAAIWWYVRDITMLLAFALGLYWLCHFRRWRCVCCGIVTLGLSLVAARGHFSAWDRSYLSSVLVQPRVAVLTNFWNLDFPFPVIAQDAGVKVHRISPSSPLTIQSILSPVKSVPGYRAIKIIGQDCSYNSTSLETGEVIGAPVLDLSEHHSSALVPRLEIRQTGAHRYSYRALINQCTASDIPLMIGHKLNELGFDSFILTRR